MSLSFGAISACFRLQMLGSSVMLLLLLFLEVLVVGIGNRKCRVGEAELTGVAGGNVADDIVCGSKVRKFNYL